MSLPWKVCNCGDCRGHTQVLRLANILLTVDSNPPGWTVYYGHGLDRYRIRDCDTDESRDQEVIRRFRPELEKERGKIEEALNILDGDKRTSHPMGLY